MPTGDPPLSRLSYYMSREYVNSITDIRVDRFEVSINPATFFEVAGRMFWSWWNMRYKLALQKADSIASTLTSTITLQYTKSNGYPSMMGNEPVAAVQDIHFNRGAGMDERATLIVQTGRLIRWDAKGVPHVHDERGNLVEWHG